MQQNNRLASASYPDPSPMPGGPISVSYSYDDNGHCVSEGVERKYEWDHAGRLRSFRNQATDATEPTQYVQYLYDASGQRVKKLNRKQLGSDWDVVVYIDGVLEQRTQQRGATTKQGAVLHVLDGGKRLGMRRTGETFDAKPENLLVLSDHLGSGSVELDWSLGDFIDREEFRPYGETSFGSYAHKRYRFTGKERDEESGLNYHGARYYAPGLARWMSPDPKGLVDGVNLYGYVRGNPVRLVDLDGAKSHDVNQNWLDYAQKEVRKKHDPDVNSLLAKPLRHTAGEDPKRNIPQVLQKTTDAAGVSHTVQLKIDFSRLEYSTKNDSVRQDSRIIHTFTIKLSIDLLDSNIYKAEIGRHLYHEMLHLIIERDKELAHGSSIASITKKYNELMRIAYSDELTNSRLLLEKPGDSPESKKAAIELAVQEFLVSRISLGTFNEDVSNRRIANSYKRTVSQLLVQENSPSNLTTEYIGKHLLEFYDKITGVAQDKQIILLPTSRSGI